MIKFEEKHRKLLRNVATKKLIKKIKTETGKELLSSELVELIHCQSKKILNQYRPDDFENVKQLKSYMQEERIQHLSELTNVIADEIALNPHLIDT